MRGSSSLLLLPLALGCARAQSVPEGSARALVQQFINAELAADTAGEHTHVYGCEEDFQPSSDYVLPVARARLLASYRLSDTVVIPVEYVVLGQAYIGRSSSFVEAGRVDTVPFRVARDTLGASQIQCGPHAANHWSVRTVQRWVGAMDSSSTAAWDRAKREANR